MVFETPPPLVNTVEPDKTCTRFCWALYWFGFIIVFVGFWWFYISFLHGCNPVLGLYLLRNHCLFGIGIPLFGIGIPIINLSRWSDCLRFIMGIPIPARACLLVNRCPGQLSQVYTKSNVCLCNIAWTDLSGSVIRDHHLGCTEFPVDDLLLFEVYHPITNVTETWQVVINNCMLKQISDHTPQNTE